MQKKRESHTHTGKEIVGNAFALRHTRSSHTHSHTQAHTAMQKNRRSRKYNWIFRNLLPFAHLSCCLPNRYDVFALPLKKKPRDLSTDHNEISQNLLEIVLQATRCQQHNFFSFASPLFFATLSWRCAALHNTGLQRGQCWQPAVAFEMGSCSWVEKWI